MVLHENEVLRLAKGLFLGFKRLVGVTVVGHFCAGIDREPGGTAQVVGLVAKAGIRCIECVGSGFILRQIEGHLLVKLTKTAPHHKGVGFLTAEKEQAKPQNGHELDQHNPGQLVGGVHSVTADVKHHKQTQHARDERDDGGITVEPHKQQKNPKDLKQHAEGD